MLPRLIEMVVRIIAPRVVPYPAVTLRVNVRRCRMPLLVLLRPPLLSWLWLRRLPAPILPAPTLIGTRLLTSRLLRLIVALRLLLCLSLWLLPLLRRRIPHRLRPVLWYMPLANSLLFRAALLLLSLLTFLLLLLLWTLLLRLLLLLLSAPILRIDSLSKRRHSAHHHCRNKARKHSRKPLHKLLQSQVQT
jgi:small-conductance mechanosensitive channel